MVIDSRATTCGRFHVGPGLNTDNLGLANHEEGTWNLNGRTTALALEVPSQPQTQQIKQTGAEETFRSDHEDLMQLPTMRVYRPDGVFHTRDLGDM